MSAHTIAMNATIGCRCRGAVASVGLALSGARVAQGAAYRRL